MPAHGDDAACTGAGVRKPSMKETAMGEGWWCGLTYMSRALSSPISRPPLHFRPFFVRPEEPFFRSDPGVCGARRARSVKDGAIAPPAGLSLTDRAPRYAGAIEGRCLVAVFSVCLGMLVVGGFSVDGHVACDDRISLYPAAPFRLATLLHAWTIAQVGRGSSLTRQTG